MSKQKTKTIVVQKTFDEKIMERYYDPEFPDSPARPTVPVVLRKSAMDLTAKEMAEIAQVKDKYERDLAAYKQAADDRRATQRRLDDEFIRDLIEDVGLTNELAEKAQKVISYVREHCGDNDRAYFASAVRDLVNIFR